MISLRASLRIKNHSFTKHILEVLIPLVSGTIKFSGVLRGGFIGEKEVNMSGFVYKTYCRVWVACYPIRFVAKKCLQIMKRVVKNVF